MEHSYGAEYQNIRLRPLEEKDIENLRIWRNDTEASRFLRPIGPVSPRMQKNWFEGCQKDPSQIIFAIEETEKLNRLVGSVALYDFDENSAELGKIQIGDPEAHGRGIGRISFAMAAWIGFQKLGVKKITASVHRENLPAYKNDMRIGFRVVGSHEAAVGGVEDEIEIDEKRLLEQNPYLKDIRFW